MRPRSLLLIAIVLMWPTVRAQVPFCGADVLREHALTPERQAAEDALYRRLIDRAPGRDRNDLLTLPVVVHVIHRNGPENVADSVVQLALEQANARLQNATPYDDATGHVSDIQLCLATVDPFGLPTTGITRQESPRTVHSSFDQLDVKATVRWDPLRYLNVWLVDSVTDPGIDGYSSFPSDMGTAVDGIVMEARHLLNNALLVHELGHYLGLFHTFQGLCLNLNCQLNGDRICDTPPDWSNWFSCGDPGCTTETQDTTGLSPFTGDVPELPNYMDYTTCPLSFSQGQVDRMRDVLIAVRAALLEGYGCGAGPSGAAPVASCVIDSSECTGRVTFTSTSVGADVLQWDVDGAGWYIVGAELVVDFDTAGLHVVTLLASGPGGADTLRIELGPRVPPTPWYPVLSGFEGFFPDIHTGAPAVCYGAVLDLVGDPLLTSHLWSTGATTSTLSMVADSSFAIRLTAVDSNGLAWTNCAWIEAGVRPPSALIANTNDTVYCNQLVHLELVPPVNAQWYIGGGMIMGHPLTYYYDHLSTNFFPMPFWAGYNDPNGCLMRTDTFNLVTLPTVPPVITQVGNDLVLDTGCLNLSWYSSGGPLNQYFGQTTLPDAAPGCYWVFCHECGVPVYSDTLCVLPTDASAHAPGPGYQVFPVPVGDRLRIMPRPTSSAPAEVMDAAGRCVWLDSTPMWSEGLDLGALSPGLYLLRTWMDGAERTWRFVKN
ncbi:MAG: hypothetical protein IPM68_11105 [Flavobacteriales bacterium]|nr:hypothetical protein [Flavobacteriales bacterium]